ncbi:MAG: DNA translocase FtsK 4TM domain-containing protein, partial [Fuerstiella sp.]
MFDYERFRNDVLALGLLALVVFVGLSFLSYDPADPPSDLVFPARQTPVNICGSTGAAISFYGRHLLGTGVWMAIAAMIAWDVSLFSREKPKRNWLSIAGTGLLLLSSCVVLHLLVPGFNSGSTYGSGGAVGAWTGAALQQAFSPAGIFILTACGVLSGWMLSPLWAISAPGVKVASIPLTMMSSVGSVVSAMRPAPRVDVDTEDDVDDIDD